MQRDYDYAMISVVFEHFIQAKRLRSCEILSWG